MTRSNQLFTLVNTMLCAVYTFPVNASTPLKCSSPYVFENPVVERYAENTVSLVTGNTVALTGPTKFQAKIVDTILSDNIATQIAQRVVQNSTPRFYIQVTQGNIGMGVESKYNTNTGDYAQRIVWDWGGFTYITGPQGRTGSVYTGDATQARVILASDVTTQGDNFTINDGPDIYTNTPITVNLVLGYELTNNEPYMLGPVPSGTTLYWTKNPITVSCLSEVKQLEISATATVDFNVITLGQVSVQRDIDVRITSGTQTPTGRLTFSSGNTNSNARISLGGGEVSITDKTSGNEYFMGQEYLITAREMTFEASLNAAGATPGEATENLTVTMTVN